MPAPRARGDPRHTEMGVPGGGGAAPPGWELVPTSPARPGWLVYRAAQGGWKGEGSGRRSPEPGGCHRGGATRHRGVTPGNGTGPSPVHAHPEQEPEQPPCPHGTCDPRTGVRGHSINWGGAQPASPAWARRSLSLSPSLSRGPRGPWGRHPGPAGCRPGIFSSAPRDDGRAAATQAASRFSLLQPSSVGRNRPRRARGPCPHLAARPPHSRAPHREPSGDIGGPDPGVSQPQGTPTALPQSPGAGPGLCKGCRAGYGVSLPHRAWGPCPTACPLPHGVSFAPWGWQGCRMPHGRPMPGSVPAPASGWKQWGGNGGIRKPTCPDSPTHPTAGPIQP